MLRTQLFYTALSIANNIINIKVSPMKATENGMEEVFPPFYIFLDVKARNLVLPGEILQCYGIPLNFHVIRLQGFII